MKKLFAIVAVIGAFTFGSIQLAQAQDAPAAEQTEQQAAPAAAQAAPAAAPAAEEGGIHKEIKVKFIEGTASFMSLVAIALVIGWKKVMLKLLKTSHVTPEVLLLLSTTRV